MAEVQSRSRDAIGREDAAQAVAFGPARGRRHSLRAYETCSGLAGAGLKQAELGRGHRRPASAMAQAVAVFETSTGAVALVSSRWRTWLARKEPHQSRLAC